jgi:hypothetical protein
VNRILKNSNTALTGLLAVHRPTSNFFARHCIN